MSNKLLVNIRRNVESFTDPYIDEESLCENSICTKCGSVYTSGRWYLKGELTKEKAAEGIQYETICPACRKMRDHVPGGVLKLSGAFIDRHRDEIMNLIRNESGDALADNPLERIMSLETVKGGIEISTTNEKLAQRIGKAIHRAYRGSIEYKWSGDDKLARINWHRE
ncbi:MAG: BCAM0308 family protein [Armatimonadota bacterium]|nr:60S ribosomal export protein NMD3 [bacterium]